MILKNTTGIFFALVLLSVCPAVSLAQKQKKINVEKKSINKIFNFQFHYTYALPGGDLGSRFGVIHNLGFGGMLKTKNNWLAGLDASYQFGTDVKENILYNLTNSSGIISNSSGFPGNISIGERGFNTFIKGGRVFALSSGNRNSGLVLMGGAGFVSHKINISTTQSNVPTLTEELKKGYDRLSMGWAVTGFAGYYFQSKNRMVNFYIGLDIIQAFTKNMRGYNYDQMAYDNVTRSDLFFGPRIGWMIPIYLTTNDQEEFYYK